MNAMLASDMHKMLSNRNADDPRPMFLDDILHDMINVQDDNQLGIDHPNRSKNVAGKGDSIFIR